MNFLSVDPNRILYTPPFASSPSMEPLAASRGSRSPVDSDSFPEHETASTSPSFAANGGAISANSSTARETGSKECFDPSPSLAQQQGQRDAPCQHSVAELDGENSNRLQTPISQWSARLQSHPPSMYLPYRPSVQEFRDMKSGLYP